MVSAIVLASLRAATRTVTGVVGWARMSGGCRSNNTPTVRNATRWPGTNATSVTTMTAGNTLMTEDSSRIHGSDSHNEKPIQHVATAKAMTNRW